MNESVKNIRPGLIFLTMCEVDTELIQSSILNSLSDGPWNIVALSAPAKSWLKSHADTNAIPFVPSPSVLDSAKNFGPARELHDYLSEGALELWHNALRSFGADFLVIVDAPVLSKALVSTVNSFIVRFPAHWPRQALIERSAILCGDSKFSVPLFRESAGKNSLRVIASTMPLRVGSKETSLDLQKKVAAFVPAVTRKAIERLMQRGRKGGRPAALLPELTPEVHSRPLIDLRYDSHERIRRVHHAFFGQEPTRFQVRVDGLLREVPDLELHKGNFPGRTGTQIAILKSCALIRTREGCCILLDQARPNPRNARFTPTEIKRALNKAQ